MSFSRYGRFRPRQTSLRNDAEQPALAHVGTAQDFLQRHFRECSQYDCSTVAERIRFAGGFLERIAETRNLMCAVAHPAQNSDKAPGPNGQRLCRLLRENPAQVWQELRRLGREILAGSYQPGPTRTTRVPKSSGRGTRPIEVFNWQDQVVQRAIVQILEPFVDHEFDELSLGYRTGHDRFEAIAKAGALMELEDRQTLLCADLRDAFMRMPHTALLRDVERRIGNQRVTQLIGIIIRAGNRCRGVAQGGALSPLLLNLYLDRHLDHPWRRAQPNVPMVRVADDLLVLSRSVEEAQRCLSDLRRLLQPTGMQLNESKTQVSRLEAGEQADWLGFTVSIVGDRLRVGLARDFYAKAERTLREALAEPDGVLRAADATRGIFDQLGPCFYSENQDDVICHVASLAGALGLEELPDRDMLLETWRCSATRFLVQCRLWRLVYRGQHDTIPGVGSGSASCHFFPALSTPAGRGDGAPVAPVSSSTLDLPPATLTVACVSATVGGDVWAYHVAIPGQRRTSTKCQMSYSHSRLRPALKAALQGIRLILPRYPVRIVTDSDYLCGDWLQTVEQCRRRGGKTLDGKTPGNWDLLVPLDREVSRRRVYFEFRSSAPPRTATTVSTAEALHK